MLARVEIRDFALIEQAVLEPQNGLLVISGETGAGKSILIDAIGALLGNKLTKDMIRYGQSKATVEALFTNADKYLPHSLLNDLEIDVQEDLILAREINQQGRSLCRINGRLASQSLLRQTAACLIDIHGQNDHQTIFKPDTHLKLLDRFGKLQSGEAFHEYKQARTLCLDLKKQLGDLGSDPAERARQLDLLEYQIDEIETAALRPGEEEKLQKKQRILASLERIQDSLEGAYALISADQDDCVPALLAQACEHLEFPAKHIEAAKKCYEDISSIIDQLSVHAADIREMLDKYQAQPGELEKIQERLEKISKLKKKYGSSYEEINQYLSRAITRRDQLSEGEARFSKLRKQLDESMIRLKSSADKLFESRKHAAASLEKGIAKQLIDLGMKSVRFAVDLSHNEPSEDTLNKQEFDQAAFLISANPGEPLKPLAQIASGGEASRILLAVKTILADVDDVPVLIFDEIDTGVSGYTAGMVASKLKQISRTRQVFCITHMAQIAAYADKHLLIEKSTDGIATSTSLSELDHEGRSSELARLLSGGIADKKARELALQLLEAAVKD